MPVDTHNLIGNHFQRVYAYGMGGADTATYSGSAANETMTALWNYTFVNTATTTHYFDRFRQLTVAGNGGLDIAVMYDSQVTTRLTRVTRALASRVSVSLTPRPTATTKPMPFSTSAAMMRQRSMVARGMTNLRRLLLMRCCGRQRLGSKRPVLPR